ncbi:cadherin-89d-like isoform x4 protein [Lasius niger]|uniref:Cadherin-89d-like isoform x4 protein n=1 Tax=Lasius niger TaxID=67767 RepID=A0A0J7L303_LASNI|nr:cadherin-89d-like isoform x4 protein [Lasius niger]
MGGSNHTDLADVLRMHLRYLSYMINCASEKAHYLSVTIFRGIHALDGDKPNTPNSDVYYAIVKGNEQGKFSLESGHRTALILRKPVDYDSGDREFNLIITATDRGVPAKSTNSTVKITVVDNDDLDPKFTQDIYKAKIHEFYPMPEYPIFTEINFTSPIHAVDRDRDINVPMRYDIISGNERGFFHLDPKNGSLFLKRAIDLDAERSLPGNTFNLQVHASQVDNPLKMTVARVEMEVLDLNDNLPQFEVDLYNISIVENLPNGFSVLQVIARDKDQGENGKFDYRLEDPSGAFSVDPTSGWLTVRDQTILDRERRDRLRMKVHAVEHKPSVVVTGDTSGGSSVDVEITLLDANDNNPIFVPGNLYELVARSDAKTGTVLGQVHAMDDDLGPNGSVLYRLQKAGNSTLRNPPFAVNESTGLITVSESPILEGRHAIFVEAADQPANPSERRFSLAVVTVDVFRADADSHSRASGPDSWEPDFVGAPYEFWVGANVPVGTSVGQIRLNDAVKTNDLIYDLLHGYENGVPFAVEERSGTITVVEEIERFDRSVYDFEAIVSDERELTLITNVSIHVVDPNDDRGIFTKGMTTAPLVFHVMENVPDALIGQVLPHNGTASGTQFLIVNQQDVPDVAIMNDGSLYAPRGLDRETRENYSVTVIAEGLRGVGVFQVRIIVDDENDHAPEFTLSSYEGRITENSPAGTEIVLTDPIAASDKDEGRNRDFTFALRGEGSGLFRIDPLTGRVYFVGIDDRVLDRETRANYDLHVIATDSGGLKSESALRITVLDANDNAPKFIRMVVLPDQGDSSDGGRRSPLLLVPENTTIGVPIIRLLATDKDEDANAMIARRYFHLDPRTAEISIARSLPSEKDIRLFVLARDSGGLSDNITVRIHVTDVNDHAPVFDKSWYTFDLAEGSYSNRKIGAVQAFDADFGTNADLSYELITSHEDSKQIGNSSRSFDVDPDEGIIRVSEINVLDVNDNAPTFHGYDELEKEGDRLPIYRVSVLENSPVGTQVAKYFAVDSKEGVITTIAKLDYETKSDHRLIVTASDLGSPISLTSSAVVLVTVLNVDDDDDDEETDNEVHKMPTFRHRYYEVEVDENASVPLLIAQLELADNYHGDHIRYSVAADGSDGREHFSVDPRNGSLYLTTEIDRETRDRYEAKVRVDRLKIGRGMPVMIYPVVGERLNGLAFNEARVVVRVKDVNDNAPRFKSRDRPILAAIPTTAHYGYEVVKVEAEDPDLGINGEIRYQILGREDVPRFAIDPLSGQVRSVASFGRDAGRVFGFDVKATDRQGAESGRSSIANVFVYVLDDQKQIIMVMGRKPIEIEPELGNITIALQNVTGLDVRVRKLEPHIEKNLIDAASTDVYLYAIDPHLNVMVDMDTLHSVFNTKKVDIKRELDEYRVLEIAGNAPRRGSQRYLLSTLEVGVVVLGCVVFVGALVTALCVTCVRRNKRRRRRDKAIFSTVGPVGFALTDPAGTLQKPPLFPTFVDGLHYDPEPFCSEVARRQSICEHGGSCVRFHTGYEDSLKSLQRHERCNDVTRGGSSHDTSSVVGRRAKLAAKRRQRFHSFSNGESVYTQEMTLQRDQHCCTGTGTEKRRHAEHHRAHSEAENNITETVIHEHPGTEISLAGTLSNPTATTLHGRSDIDEGRRRSSWNRYNFGLT